MTAAHRQQLRAVHDDAPPGDTEGDQILRHLADTGAAEILAEAAEADGGMPRGGPEAVILAVGIRSARDIAVAVIQEAGQTARAYISSRYGEHPHPEGG